jgi:predicted metal-dependent hydrolase
MCGHCRCVRNQGPQPDKFVTDPHAAAYLSARRRRGGVNDALRVGVAVFNAGDHRAAHEAWEDVWLSRAAGTPDERLLHGLIQYAAAVHHARRRNWTGAGRLAGSAGRYLADLDADARGVNVGNVRAYLQRLAADPEFAERRRPLPLRVDGDTLEPTDLAFENAASAATLLAAEYGAFEETIVADAVRYARAELDEEQSTEPGDGSVRRPQRRDPGFVGMVFDFAADRDRRSLVYDRLRAHVERRRSEERDASGLFE